MKQSEEEKILTSFFSPSRLLPVSGWRQLTGSDSLDTKLAELICQQHRAEPGKDSSLFFSFLSRPCCLLLSSCGVCSFSLPRLKLLKLCFLLDNSYAFSFLLSCTTVHGHSVFFHHSSPFCTFGELPHSALVSPGGCFSVPLLPMSCPVSTSSCESGSLGRKEESH